MKMFPVEEIYHLPVEDGIRDVDRRLQVAEMLCATLPFLDLTGMLDFFCEKHGVQEGKELLGKNCLTGRLAFPKAGNCRIISRSIVFLQQSEEDCDQESLVAAQPSTMGD